VSGHGIVPVQKIDRMARLREVVPNGPVKGDIQTVIDYDRGETH
jgi:hypothetical protein